MTSRKKKLAQAKQAAAALVEAALTAASEKPEPPKTPRSPQTEDRLTETEREAMERFFGIGPRYPEWPVSALQRRMQSSRG